MHTVTKLLDQEPRTPHHVTSARSPTRRAPSDYDNKGSFLTILSIFL